MSSTENEELRLVTLLSNHMVLKLAENRFKSHWDYETLQFFSMRLTQEKKELMRAVQSGASAEDVWREAADIANFAAMLADNYAKGNFENHKPQTSVSDQTEADNAKS